MSDPPLLISVDDYELISGSMRANEEVELKKMDAILDAHLMQKLDSSTHGGLESECSSSSSNTFMNISTTSGIMDSVTSGPLSFSFDYPRERRDLKERYDSYKRDLGILMKKEQELRYSENHSSLTAINQRIGTTRDQLSLYCHLLRRVRYTSIEEMQWNWNTFAEDFKCAICLDTMSDCRAVLGCLHRFCKNCLDTTFNQIHGRERGHRCPACNSHMPSKRHAREDLRYDQLIRFATSLNMNNSELQILDTTTLQSLHAERTNKIRQLAATNADNPRSSSTTRNRKQSHEPSVSNGNNAQKGRPVGSSKENIHSGKYQKKKSIGKSKGSKRNEGSLREKKEEMGFIHLSLKPLNLVQRNGEYMLNLGPGYMSVPGLSDNLGNGHSSTSTSTDKNGDKMDVDGHADDSTVNTQWIEERLIVLKTPQQMDTFINVYQQYLQSNPRPVPPDLLQQQGTAENSMMDVEESKGNGIVMTESEPVSLEDTVVISIYERSQCQKHPTFAQSLLQYYRDEITKLLANKAMLKPYITVPSDTTVEHLKAYVNRRKAYEETAIASVTNISLTMENSNPHAASLNQLVHASEESSFIGANNSGIDAHLNLGTMHSRYTRAYDIYFLGHSNGISKFVKLVDEQELQDVVLSMYEEGELEFFFWWRPNDADTSISMSSATSASDR
jgi:hypothetical protein